jgi:Flp pilus assembly CpaF family ATPase
MLLTPSPKTSKTADVEKKGDISMAQIYDGVIVNDPNRLYVIEVRRLF